MKYTKRLLVAFFLFFSSQFVFSQDISQASEKVKKIAKIGTDRWRNTLVLTTKQAEKLLSLTTKYEMKKTEIYKLDSASAEELNTQLKELEKEHHKSIEAMLSETQIKKFKSKVVTIKG